MRNEEIEERKRGKGERRETETRAVEERREGGKEEERKGGGGWWTAVAEEGRGREEGRD